MAKGKPPSHRVPHKTESKSAVQVRTLDASDWPIILKLFTAKGACGGCWCMYWRLPHGGKLWEDNKGDKNKRAFKRLIQAGRVHGCLAFVGDDPVGWCCLGPRQDFPRLETVRALQHQWDDSTWSVTCFYISTSWRRQGIASALLEHGVALAKKLGAKKLEGYPVRYSSKNHGEVPAAFAWTGVNAIFEKQRFVNVSPPDHARDVFVRRFRSSGS